MPVFPALVIFFLIIYSDLRSRIIPDVITLPSILFGLGVNSSRFGINGSYEALSGLFLGVALVLISGLIGIKIWKSPGIGGGDVKLLGMIGSFFGPLVVVMTYAIYPFMASLYAMTFKKETIPLAPFIITSCLISLKLKGSL